MEANLYAPPDSDLNNDQFKEKVRRIQGRIRGGWIAGVSMAFLGVAYGTILILGSQRFSVDSAALQWQFSFALLYVGLSFGVFKRSRVCALAFFCKVFWDFAIACYYLPETLQHQRDVFPNEAYSAYAAYLVPLGIKLLFLWLFGRAALATFQYHKLIKLKQPV